ncbi:type II secretion system protein [Shewanella psychrotolerans]|uniref:type II secretion system protein n=1 Tax=Shewanella psychrotolerans TaxID=2864206 RepID=UPI001C65BB76|nr:type II secretion system protein [Shewanella psychrotolerans]QYK01796.1 type II secretion system GspH family protein [Shewanella psychrotolerans]
MNKQKGFTLIELVVVIIILGILAVTAAPKFINLQSDARKSTLEGIKGAIQGANGLVYAKAALAGDEKKASADWTGTAGVDIGTSSNVKTDYGYLQATSAELKNAIDADFGGDWEVESSTTTEPKTIVLKQKGAAASVAASGTEVATGCTLTYTEAASTTVVPTYAILDNGC